MHGITLVCDRCEKEFKGNGYPYSGLGIQHEIKKLAIQDGWIIGFDKNKKDYCNDCKNVADTTK